MALNLVGLIVSLFVCVTGFVAGPFCNKNQTPSVFVSSAVAWGVGLAWTIAFLCKIFL